MASGKKVSEAFNMLMSMYQDDDDDMEDADGEEDGGGQEESEQALQQVRSGDDMELEDREQQESKGTDTSLPGSVHGGTPTLQSETSLTPRRSNLRPPTPQEEGLQRSRRERPAIVDYGHDEVAMSPEAEEGEILGNGRPMYNMSDDHQERPLIRSVQISTPNIRLTPPYVRVENSEFDTVDNPCKEVQGEDLAGVDTHEDVDPLDKFLPSPPITKCPEELQEKINKFLAYKRQGMSFNAQVRNRKDYRNPDFLLHAVSYQDIDQVGSCFSKDVFDPHGYDESDYYDVIEVDMKRELDRKEQEKKKSPKVEFVPGGTQQSAVLAAAKISTSVSGGPGLPSGSLQSTSVSAEAVSREGRQNKKSKWDKVDVERRTTSGGQEAQTAAGSHAALLSSANAGSGYALFAQQKRKEAEEKRSSERRVDRRS